MLVEIPDVPSMINSFHKSELNVAKNLILSQVELSSLHKILVAEALLYGFLTSYILPMILNVT